MIAKSRAYSASLMAGIVAIVSGIWMWPSEGIAEIQLQLCLERTAVLIGEPLVGYISIMNSGDDEYILLSRMDPEHGDTQFAIARNDGGQRVIRCSHETSYLYENDDVLSSKGELVCPIMLMSSDGMYIADREGSIEIVAVHNMRTKNMSSNSKNGRVLRSNAVRVDIGASGPGYIEYAAAAPPTITRISVHGYRLREIGGRAQRIGGYEEVGRLIELYAIPRTDVVVLRGCGNDKALEDNGRDMLMQRAEIAKGLATRWPCAQMVWTLVGERLQSMEAGMRDELHKRALAVDGSCR